jgi:hypothetical protein
MLLEDVDIMVVKNIRDYIHYANGMWLLDLQNWNCSHIMSCESSAIPLLLLSCPPHINQTPHTYLMNIMSFMFSFMVILV